MGEEEAREGVSAPVLLLFGLAAPEGAPPALDRALARMEQDVVRTLAVRGFQVRPASARARRPALGELTSAVDLAGRYDADRLLVLDLAKDRSGVWVAHFLRGLGGAFDYRKVGCKGAPDLSCPGLVNGILAGLRPRAALDVDMGAMLRERSKAVTRCVRAEDRRPVAERIFGTLELELEVRPSGKLRVRAVAPARVASTRLGRCLTRAFEVVDVGPFEGEAIRVRIPVDL